MRADVRLPTLCPSGFLLDHGAFKHLLVIRWLKSSFSTLESSTPKVGVRLTKHTLLTCPKQRPPSSLQRNRRSPAGGCTAPACFAAPAAGEQVVELREPVHQHAPKRVVELERERC